MNLGLHALSEVKMAAVFYQSSVMEPWENWFDSYSSQAGEFTRKFHFCPYSFCMVPCGFCSNVGIPPPPQCYRALQKPPFGFDLSGPWEPTSLHFSLFRATITSNSLALRSGQSHLGDPFSIFLPWWLELPWSLQLEWTLEIVMSIHLPFLTRILLDGFSQRNLLILNVSTGSYKL